jgi:hypothetical protein
MTDHGREQHFVRVLLDLSFSEYVGIRTARAAFVSPVAAMAATLLRGIFMGAPMIAGSAAGIGRGGTSNGCLI